MTLDSHSTVTIVDMIADFSEKFWIFNGHVLMIVDSA